jgi:hypothetical protein
MRWTRESRSASVAAGIIGEIRAYPVDESQRFSLWCWQLNMHLMKSGVLPKGHGIIEAQCFTLQATMQIEQGALVTNRPLTISFGSVAVSTFWTSCFPHESVFAVGEYVGNCVGEAVRCVG